MHFMVCKRLKRIDPACFFEIMEKKVLLKALSAATEKDCKSFKISCEIDTYKGLRIWRVGGRKISVVPKGKRQGPREK